MKLKTKDGKYFSEIGNWGSLVTAFFAVIVLKVVQSGLFNFWAGTVIFAVVIGIFIFFSDKGKWVRAIWGKIKEIFPKIFQFFINNWFSSTLVILAVFVIYWSGVRPVIVRKSCSVINWVTPASPEIPASASWGNPKCEPRVSSNVRNPKSGNAFDRTVVPSSSSGTGNIFDQLLASPAVPEGCLPWYPSIPAKPEMSGERKANDNEYRLCLRENGI